MWEFLDIVFSIFGDDIIQRYLKMTSAPYEHRKRVKKWVLYGTGALFILALIGLFLAIEGYGIVKAIGIFSCIFSLSLIVLSVIVGYTIRLILKFKLKKENKKEQ